MPNPGLPEPTITLSKTDARRFLLAHQRLWPPRGLHCKNGILNYIRHVGCIQFDPIDVVGRNPELVLQARVANYRPNLLDELLYADRLLLDAWDKVSSISLAADRPYFARHRALMLQQHGDASNPPMQIAHQVKEAILQRGPLSSANLEHRTTLNWSWGQPTRLGRASLEILYAMGELGVHHRAGTRRFFDLIERLLPVELLAAPEPNPTDEEYQNWHVLRRVGGLGLANPSAAEYWLAILGVKAAVRRATLTRLVEGGDLVAVAVDGVPGRTFFLRTADLLTLQAVRTGSPPEPQAAFLGPLDNLLWDRALLRWVFGLDYIWEVYKPQTQRKYGYYVLPVLYGDRFVARFDPAFDKLTRQFTIANWWWEPGVQPDGAMEQALIACFQAFLQYLNADRVRLGERIAGDRTLRWVQA